MPTEYWYDEKVIERFFSKVDKKGDDECWEWLAGKHKNGYGGFGLEGKMKTAHRVSFELHHKRFIVDKMLLLHSCDNRGCVNPYHLREGTNQDNMDDMVGKGRQSRLKGILHGRSKLTEEQVIQIREKYAAGNYTQQQLAYEYNISRQRISEIVNRKRWTHI